jgi:N-6 DNA Methylase
MAVNKPVGTMPGKARSASVPSSRRRSRAKRTGPSGVKLPDGSWIRRKAPRRNHTRACGGKRPDSEPAVLAVFDGVLGPAGLLILSRDHLTVDGARSHRADSRTSPGPISVRRVRGQAALRLQICWVLYRWIYASAAYARSDPALQKANGDIFGRIYEYFLTQFADLKAHDGGEFFTLYDDRVVLRMAVAFDQCRRARPTGPKRPVTPMPTSVAGKKRSACRAVRAAPSPCMQKASCRVRRRGGGGVIESSRRPLPRYLRGRLRHRHQSR